MSFLTYVVFRIAYYAATIGKFPLTQVTPPIRSTSPIKKTKLRDSGSYTSSSSVCSQSWRAQFSSPLRPCKFT